MRTQWIWNPVALLLIGILYLYRYTLSALLGRTCRFLPSCSEYMIDAIKLHGATKGAWLGLKRLLRCHPYGSYGFDPVPHQVSQKITKKPKEKERRLK